MRRFTRLTNAFSQKLENHHHAPAPYFLFYNSVRIHKALRVTPAMAAGVTDRLWGMEDVVALLDARGPPPAKHAGADDAAGPTRPVEMDAGREEHRQSRADAQGSARAAQPRGGSPENDAIRG